MSGLSILGICLAVVGVLLVGWSFTLTPGELLNSRVMIMLAGGLLAVAIGLYMIANVAPTIKVTGVWLAAVAVMAYIYTVLPDSKLIVQLISFVPVIGLAAWVTMKLLK